MKNLTILLLCCLMMLGCEPEKAPYPRYKFSTQNYCPDTLQVKRNEWITETIRATDQHLSAGDYENPEDVVIRVGRLADELFYVHGEGLEIDRTEYSNKEFVPKDKLTQRERVIFEQLRSIK